jgi:small GTP-binding protein
MALINYTPKEITLKIVYYGPGLSGKTTNLQHLHATITPDRRGKLISLATESDRTLFFDFMPVAFGKISDFTVKFQLYTVPGQVMYNATRKLVLKGADAVVFVADSQTALKQENIESLQNMRDNLLANNLDPENIPLVLQYNKRDLDDVLPVETLDKDLNSAGYPTVNSEAINGKGVNETFQAITKLLLKHIAIKYKIGVAPPTSRAVTAPVQEHSENLVLERLGAQDTVVYPAPEARPEAVFDKSHFSLAEQPFLGKHPMDLPLAEQPLAEQPFVELPLDELLREEEPPVEDPFAEDPFAEQPPAEQPSATTQFQGLDKTIAEMHSTLAKISVDMNDSNVETMLEQLMYSFETTKKFLSEILDELKASKKNQEETIDLLKKIQSALSPPSRAAKRA